MNKKLIWKFNIIDLLIIGIVLLSLFALFYRMISGSDADERDYTLTYICEDAPLTLLYDIKSGEECADADLGTDLGIITAVNAEANPEDDDRGRAAIAAEVTGFETDHGVTIGDSVYLKGKTVNLIVGDSVFEVYIKDIE